MQTIIGLDFGSHSLKATLTRSTFRSFELLGFFEQPYAKGAEATPFDDDLSPVREALERLFSEHDLPRDALFACAVPAAKVSTKVLFLPFKDRKKIVQALPFELENFIPFELSEIVYDFQVIETTETGVKLLVCLLKRDLLLRLLELLGSFGIDPKFVTVDVFALANLTSLNLAEHQGTYAVVDLGHSTTKMCVLNGDTLQLGRSVAVGGRKLTRLLRDKLDLSPEDALAIKHERGEIATEEVQGDDRRIIIEVLRPGVEAMCTEISKLLRTYEGGEGKKIEELYLCGGTYMLRGLPQFLSQHLGIKCYPLKYLEGDFNKISRVHGKGSVLAQSLGIALSTESSRRRNQINFRKGEFNYKKDLGEIKPMILKYAVMAVVLLLLGFINLYSKYTILASNDEKITTEVVAVFRDTLPAASVNAKNLTKTTAVLKSKITENKARIEALQIGSLTALDLLRQISAHVPNDVTVDVKELDIDLNRITMKGETNSISSVDAIVASLKTFEAFSKVDKGEIKDGFKPGWKRFILTITVNRES